MSPFFLPGPCCGAATAGVFSQTLSSRLLPGQKRREVLFLSQSLSLSLSCHCVEGSSSAPAAQCMCSCLWQSLFSHCPFTEKRASLLHTPPHTTMILLSKISAQPAPASPH